MKYENFCVRFGLTKLYTSISNLPMVAWNKLHETGNLAHLIKKGAASRGRLNEVWDKIQNEFLDRFGLTDDYRKYMELKLRYIKLTAKYMQTLDRDIEMQLTLLEIDIKDKEASMASKGIGFNEGYGWLTKQIGSYLPLNKVSVEEYYSLMRSQSKLSSRG